MPEESDFFGSVTDPVLRAEVVRQYGLGTENFAFRIPDTDLMRMLAESRRVVRAIPGAEKDIPVPSHDFERGRITVPVPRDLALTLAELCSRVRALCATQWETTHAGSPALFHAGELLDAASINPQFSPDADAAAISDCAKHYLLAAAMIENLATDIREGREPDSADLDGVLQIDVPALEAASAILEGVRYRLQKIFDVPPVHLMRSMKEWRLWQDRIETATESDAADIHSLYDGVLINPERLIKLDPRFATPAEFTSVTGDVRNHGAMFKALKAGQGGDEIEEGLKAGRIVIVRDDPQEDAVGVPGELLGFYNVIGDPGMVRNHMKSDLHFSTSPRFECRYESVSDLPRFSHLQEPTGEMRTIAYIDEEGALRIFKAAASGKLAWSVDHAVKMDGPRKLQRYAQLGTALKLNDYQHFQNDGKTSVLLKIATVLGADASVAAKERSVPPVDLGEWTKNGPCPWAEDSSGVVILSRPIVNMGSMLLNQRLGAHEVFTVTEEFERDGVKVRILWRYFEQPLPPEIP